MATQRRPRRPARGKWALGVGVVVLLVAAIGGYLIWSALAARSDLQAAEKSATRLQSALLDGDRAQAERSLQEFATQTDSARGHTDGVVWRLSEHLPFLGDDARAVRLVALSASDVGRRAHETLFAEDDTDVISALVPHGGRVDLAAVRRAAPMVGELDGALTSATTVLSDVRPSELTRWVRPSFERFDDRIRKAQRVMVGADAAVQVMPQLLGADGPRTYLLRFNNNAEIRASGGMPGAWALLRAENGRISMVRQGTAGDFPQLKQPIRPQSAAENKIYDIHPTVFYQDTGFIPDFPRSAELVDAMWAKRFPAQKLDGVIETDTVTLSYLLGATGPVKAGGITLTSRNAVDELLNNVYLRLPDNDQQDAFYAEVAKRVFDKVSGGVASPARLAEALSAGVNQGRVHLRSFDPRVQEKLDGSLISGEMDFEQSRNAELGIYLNDATGSKMSYYLTSKATTTAERCHDGVQTLRTKASFAEKDLDLDKLNESITGTGRYGIPKGQQAVLVRIYGPVGGSFGEFKFDGKRRWTFKATDRGRPVVVTAVQLDPGQRMTVEWTTRTARGQAGDAVQQLTPGLTERDYETRIPTACG